MNVKSRRDTLVGIVTIGKNSKGQALFGSTTGKERDKEIRQKINVQGKLRV